MKQIEHNLDVALNNDIPEHQTNFWADLDSQLSKHIPIVDEQSDPPLLKVVEREPAPPEKRYRRSGVGFLAAAACTVAALGFAISQLPRNTAAIEVASAGPVDYTSFRPITADDEPPLPEQSPPSSDELQSHSVDASTLGMSNNDGAIAPTAISQDRKHAIYRVDGTIIYAPIDQPLDLNSIVVFDAKKLNDDISRVIAANSSFSASGPIVAMPHPEGIVIWNYETNESTFYTICPGFACAYYTQDRFSGDVWFDETGVELHFVLVDDDDDQTPVKLVFGKAVEEYQGPAYESDDDKLPNPFDNDVVDDEE